MKPFLSTDVNDLDFARVQSDINAGALPPGPAPAEGDWFTKLLERFRNIHGSATGQGHVETSALLFAEPGAHVHVPKLPINLSSGFTLEAWVQLKQVHTTGAPTQAVAILGPVSLKAYDGKWWQTSIYDQGKRVADTKFRSPGVSTALTHVALQFDGKRMSLFINGVNDTLGDLPAEPLNRAFRNAEDELDMTLGAPSDVLMLDGAISAMRLSRTARYTENFTPQVLKNDEHTVALYDFHESDGDMLHDVSGNGHHGTIHKARWVKIAASSTSLDVSEPPPLEEWLKGREIITVKQDGSGMFSKIQDAVDALKPGQVVEVLDRGPYVERFSVKSLDDVGVVSRADTVVVIKDWIDNPHRPEAKLGMDVSGCQGFRLSGLRFLFQSLPDAPAKVQFYATPDLTIEDCVFACASSTMRKLVCSLFPASNDESAATTIRHSLFQNVSTMFPAPAWKSTVNIHHCVLRSDRFTDPFDTGQHLLTIYVSDDSTAMTTAVIRHNVISSSEHPAISLTGNAERNDANAFTIEDNTMLNDGESLGSLRVLTGVSTTNLSWRGNLLLGRPDLIFSQGADSQLPVAKSNWRISGNAMSTASIIRQDRLPYGETNYVLDLSMINPDLAALDCFRIPSTGLLATGGGNESPQYIGALLPGPAPAEGDWFTQLQERWKDAIAESSDGSARLDINEPPPLDE